MSFLSARRFRSSVAIVGVALALVGSGCTDPKLHEELAELKEKNVRLKAQLDAANKAAAKEKKCQLQLRRSEGKIAHLEGEVAKLDEKKRAAQLEKLRGTFGVEKGQKLYATLETSMGNLHVELFWDKAPNTVANFVQLAEGTKEWTDTKTGKKVKRPLYDGTIFHRVIPNFMVQGGDPLGNGTGGPGFKFADEFHPDLRHDRPGILSMANSGRNSNGSQFFITERPTPHLNDRHTVFGALVDQKEMAIIKEMARVEKSQGNRSKPAVDIVLKRVRIGRGKMVQ